MFNSDKHFERCVNQVSDNNNVANSKNFEYYVDRIRKGDKGSDINSSKTL